MFTLLSWYLCVCVCARVFFISTWQRLLSPQKKALLYTNCIHCFCVYTFMDVMPLTESSTPVIIIVCKRERKRGVWEFMYEV